MSDDGLDLNIFQEPEDFFEAEKPYTHQKHVLRDGRTLHLRLVGHNPLWGHHLWQAGIIVSSYLESNSGRYLRNKSVLELGAAAALPSLVAAVHDADLVVATDYPDAELISNIQYNVDQCSLLAHRNRIISQGYLWGAEVGPLLAHLDCPSTGFDTLILADLLFNHSCHDSLFRTIKRTLARGPESRALVFFTPYRPWLFDKDMAFFDLVKNDPELDVDKLGEWKMEKVMFENDQGDELLRRTVFGFAIRWILDPCG